MTTTDLLMSVLVKKDLYVDFHDWLDAQVPSLAQIYLEQQGVIDMPPPKRPRKGKTTKKKIVKKKTTITLPTSATKPGSTVSDYITCWYGPPGVGKTTFAANLFKRPLFLSTDRGTRFISTRRIEVGSWLDVEGALEALEAHDPDELRKLYDAVVIDHVDDVCTFGEEYVCQQLGIEGLEELEWGRGWKAYKQVLRGLVYRLMKTGLAISFIAHEQVKEIADRAIKISRTQPAMPKSAWNVIVPMADVIGYCSYKRIKVAGKRQMVRTIETEGSEVLYVKDRTDRKKPTSGIEELDGKKFASTFTGAKTNGPTKEIRSRRRARRSR